MVNQALRMKIAYWSDKKKEEKKGENTRDRSAPYGSDKNEKLKLKLIQINHKKTNSVAG